MTFPNKDLDDFVVLRSDGTPTYMLAVVVDDHDMGVTHVIRGDDHLTNAARQKILYDALGWPLPEMAHIPLIHGPDGAKLSKRHGALGVDAYRAMGYLPEAMLNYLVRLGWSHGDDEIMSQKDMIAWFDVRDVNKAPARFDFAKLGNINAHYIRAMDDAALLATLTDALPHLPDGAEFAAKLDEPKRARVARRPAASEGARQDAERSRRWRGIPCRRAPARPRCSGAGTGHRRGARHPGAAAAGPHGASRVVGCLHRSRGESVRRRREPEARRSRATAARRTHRPHRVARNFRGS